jgi:hypothetical protein
MTGSAFRSGIDFPAVIYKKALRILQRFLIKFIKLTGSAQA